MSITVTLDRPRKERISRSLSILTGTITFGNPYTTGGGELLTDISGEFKSLKRMTFDQKGGYMFEFDKANNKVKVLNPSVAITPAGTNAAELTHTHALLDGSMIYNWVSGGGDIKGSTVPAGTEENTDQVAGPVNPALIGAEQDFTTMAGTKVVTNSPDVARNVIIVIHNDTGGALDLYEGITTFTVVGTFRGAEQTEGITITSDAGNKSVVAAKFRFKAGVKPFDTVTGITYDNAAAGTLKCSVAPGSLLGYPVDSDAGLVGDFIKATVDAANYTITGKVSIANKTFNVGTIADGADVGVQYKVDFDQGPTAAGASHNHVFTGAAVAATVGTEVGGINLSTLIVSFIAVGI